MEDVTLSTIADAQKHARDWLFTSAAPLWASSGVLGDGMFAERIGLDGVPAVGMERRMRVQARQIYSFSVIGQLGWDGPWRSIVEQSVDILINKGRQPNGMFVHKFAADGAVINRSLDLYDHAFGLFCLAHAARALGRGNLVRLAAEIRDEMLETWWRPEGGFWEGELTPCPPYRQNPHMHMFEAALVNYEVSLDPKWRELSDQLGNLFCRKFQDQKTGAVTEYFDTNWAPLAGGEGEIVEPGHCLEWAWLFEISDRDPSISDRLTRFARQFGIESVRGVAINEVYLDGRVRDGGARLWPQTERLKAAIARYNRLKTREEADEIVAAYRGLCLYFNVPVRGVWRDRLNADGGWVEEAAPASSFYHIVCAMNELLGLRI